MSWFSKVLGCFGQGVSAAEAGFKRAGVPEERMEEALAGLFASDDGKVALEDLAYRRGLRLVPPKPVFVAQPPKLVKTLSLRQQFKTPEKAIKAGAYPAGHDTYITSTTYPMRDGMQEDTDVFGLDMADCFDHDPTTAEVVALAEQHGYERPVYEDCLRAGGEHTGEQYERPFVFLHIPDAGGVVLWLVRWSGKRRLSRSFDGPSGRWDREHCVFFFRRKAAA